MKKAVLLSLMLWVTMALPASKIHIHAKLALKIGVKIWHNEAAGRIDGLTAWNRGEDFASVGIGHFVWYHDKKRRHGHVEGFPRLLKYLDSKGVNLPRWLRGPGIPLCPWVSKKEFHMARNSRRMLELRLFLLETMPLQAKFIAERLESALPKLLRKVPKSQRSALKSRFYDLANSPKGLFALVDYVNFKGEGGGSFKNYHHQGWGLLQVLQTMDTAPDGLNLIESFVWSADKLLTQRVLNAPTGHQEVQWLEGWRNRVYGYL